MTAKSMRELKRKRLLLFFLIAILLPASALIVLAWRLVRQEAELANSRAGEERRTAVEQLRRELSARLEAITLQEINRRIRAPGSPGTERPSDPSIVLVTTLDGDRMRLPWVSTEKRSHPTQQFDEARQRGELLEFRNDNPAAALVAYSQAVAAAKSPGEKCAAQLMSGRVLLKAGRVQAATATYLTMLQECGDVSDDFGIRFRLYAAERLINACKDSGAAFADLIKVAADMRWMSPQDAFLVRSLLAPASDERAPQARKNIERKLQQIDQVSALAKEFPRILPLAVSDWVALGEEPWLVSMSPEDEKAPRFVFVVSARELAPPMAVLVSKDTETSIPLGNGFSGLNVEWQPGRFAAPRAMPASLYVAALSLIIGATVLGGYLVLRDVNRDLRVAELRTQFVASVSHELKTPLTAVRMFAETLSMGRAKDERSRQEYLATIMNESERLARLVDNVLDFSKIEQRRKVYHMRPASLADVVRSAAQAMQYPLEQLGFKLTVSIDESIPSIEADPDALQQAILNLLSNAMKYSGSSPAIELNLRSGEREAVIEVIDHGIGIPQDEQPRIFEKFYRVRSKETESVAGTGLGLTLVKHTAEAHGGRVEVSSAPGQGSTFSMHLPLGGREVQA
jgi:signal transduction histidine kinase